MLKDVLVVLLLALRSGGEELSISIYLVPQSRTGEALCHVSGRFVAWLTRAVCNSAI